MELKLLKDKWSFIIGDPYDWLAMPSRCISWIKSFLNDGILKTLKPSSTINQVKVKSRQFFSRCQHTKCKNFSAFFQRLCQVWCNKKHFVCNMDTLLHVIAQEMKFLVKLFFKKCNQICSYCDCGSDLVPYTEDTLMEDFTFLCSGLNTSIIHKFLLKALLIKESCNINTRHEIWSG